jgi:uncharacterized membrane protein
MIHDIEVDVPVRTAYNQWTQFEDFPLFMDHVQSVTQLTEDTVRWKVKIAGVTREWDARVIEQTPDQRIAWIALDGTQNAGVVTFHALSNDRTRVVLQLDMDPQGLLETIADKGGFVRDRAKKDLADFKAFIEQRGRETGAYRKTIDREAGIVDDAAGDPRLQDDRDATIDLRDDPERQDEFAREQSYSLRPDQPPVARERS